MFEGEAITPRSIPEQPEMEEEAAQQMEGGPIEMMPVTLQLPGGAKLQTDPASSSLTASVG
eukprot:scaffold156809_cov30-Prasinocladus_malaysianus.AAC.1